MQPHQTPHGGEGVNPNSPRKKEEKKGTRDGETTGQASSESSWSWGAVWVRRHDKEMGAGGWMPLSQPL